MADSTNDPFDKAADHPGRLDLPPVATPPTSLKTRVLATLHNEGLLASNPAEHQRARIGRRALVAAAAAVLFAAGFGAHAITTNTTVPPPFVGERYLLLLYGDVDPGPGRTEADVVAEYGAWAAQLAERGHLEMGEKLADDADTIVEEAVSGFFVIRARSEREARSIADDCPHRRYGGNLTLRLIEET